MKRLFILILISISVLLIAKGDNGFDMESFESSINNAKSQEEINQKFVDVFAKVKDLDTRRVLQDFWKEQDQEVCMNYFTKKLEDNKESAMNAYFVGRILDDKVEKLKYGKLSLKYDSEFIYAKRLICAAYMRGYLGEYPYSDEYIKLEKTFKEDQHYIEDYFEVAPDDFFSGQLRVEYYTKIGEFDYALEYLTKLAKRPESAQFMQDLTGYYLLINQEEIAKKRLMGYINSLIKAGRITEADKMDYLDWTLTNMYMHVFMFDKAKKHLMQDKSFARKQEKMMLLAQIETRSKNYTEAFAALNNSIDLGFSSKMQLTTNPDFEKLKSEPEWKTLLTKIQKVRDEKKPERKKEVLSHKINKPSPQWALKDANGDVVELKSLRGKVVILDFWATWCGPCRMAMPLLDEYTRNKPENVEVFSINTWENAPEKVKKFMVENDFTMKLLFGNKELAKDYGFNGIPYICVIDQDGNIRYEENGFSENLGENLIWWVDSLIK